MDERRTHYQVSFTSGQALAVFLVLLASLAGAYFFGLMTGLGGRGEPEASIPEGTSATDTAAAQIAASDVFPTPVLGIQPKGVAEQPTAGRPAAVAEGRPRPTSVQLFEDRGEGEGASGPPPQVAGAPSPGASPSGFWVQVVSLSSERDARARSAHLVQRGYPAAVVPGPAPGKGTVYRVRVGPFERREDAARAASRLSAEEKTETWIVPTGR